MPKWVERGGILKRDGSTSENRSHGVSSIFDYSTGQAPKPLRLLSIDKRKKRMKGVYSSKKENCESITFWLWSADKLLYFNIESRMLCKDITNSSRKDSTLL